MSPMTGQRSVQLGPKASSPRLRLLDDGRSLLLMFHKADKHAVPILAFQKRRKAEMSKVLLQMLHCVPTIQHETHCEVMYSDAF